jgi:hypothetical protein
MMSQNLEDPQMHITFGFTILQIRRGPGEIPALLLDQFVYVVGNAEDDVALPILCFFI